MTAANSFAKLTAAHRAKLLEELNYLNLDEIRGFCGPRGIPYKVLVEHPTGKTRATKDTDRKPIVLARLRRYLATGEVGDASCIPVEIVRMGKPPVRLEPGDRLYYRWYAKEHEGVIRALRSLTEGRFQDGAVARVVAMEFWTRGQAPTLDEFAKSWMTLKAEEHRLLTPEYAYLTDRKHRRAEENWKDVRVAKARSALKTLARIAPIQVAAGTRLKAR